MSGLEITVVTPVPTIQVEQPRPRTMVTGRRPSTGRRAPETADLGRGIREGVWRVRRRRPTRGRALHPSPLRASSAASRRVGQRRVRGDRRQPGPSNPTRPPLRRSAAQLTGFGRSVHGCEQTVPAPVELHMRRQSALPPHRIGASVSSASSTRNACGTTHSTHPYLDDRSDRVIFQQQHAARAGRLAAPTRRASADPARAR